MRCHQTKTPKLRLCLSINSRLLYIYPQEGEGGKEHWRGIRGNGDRTFGRRLGREIAANPREHGRGQANMSEEPEATAIEQSATGSWKHGRASTVESYREHGRGQENTGEKPEATPAEQEGGQSNEQLDKVGLPIIIFVITMAGPRTHVERNQQIPIQG